MADSFELAQLNLLRQKINQYLTQQRPRIPPWQEMLQWLTDDGNIARNFIIAKGVDVFIELRDEQRNAKVSPSTPPSSPDQLVCKTQDLSDDAPCMINPHGLYHIRVVNNGQDDMCTPLSANICKGSQSYINRNTIERSCEIWSIDPQTDTVTLSWLAQAQWVKIFGDACVNRIVCKVIPPDQMCNVDVAIAEDKSSWNAPLVFHPGATSRTMLPAGEDDRDEEEETAYAARFVLAMAREATKLKRSREKDDSDAEASRARKGRKS